MIVVVYFILLAHLAHAEDWRALLGKVNFVGITEKQWFSWPETVWLAND